MSPRKSWFVLTLSIATHLLADESTEALRKEFEIYKATSESRIQSIEKRDHQFRFRRRRSMSTMTTAWPS